MGNSSKNEFNKNLYNNIVPHIIRLETEKREMEDINTAEYYGNEMDPLKIHNKYIGIMKLLEGKDDSNSSKKKTGIKGEDVFPRLNLNNVDYEKLARVFILYGEITGEINETYDSNKPNNKKNRKVPNHKLLSNSKKITLRHDKKFIRKLLAMAENEANKNCDSAADIRTLVNFHKIFKCTVKYHQENERIYYAIKNISLIEYYIKNRIFYLYFSNIFASVTLIFLNIIKEAIYTCEIIDFEYDKIDSIWRDFYLAYIYVDIYCWTILQSVIIHIIRNLQMENINENVERIKDLIDVKIKEFYDAEKEPVEIERGKEYYYISLFFLFMYRRSELLLNIKVLNSLKEQSKDIEKPDSEYAVDITDNIKLDKDTISLFNEGKKISKSTEYNRYILNEGMLELMYRWGRNFYADGTCIKGAYLTAINDKLSYDGLSLKRMLGKYLKDKTYFDGNDMSYFFDEATNMEINRERDQLNEFWCKNEMQESLYHLAVLILSRLNPEEIIKKADQYFCGILDEIENILEEERYKNQL